MILSDIDLNTRFHEIFPDATREDYRFINPASIDVRIGKHICIEHNKQFYVDGMKELVPGHYSSSLKQIGIGGYTESYPFLIEPGEFILVSLLERIKVPNDLAIEFKLKSSRAREGYDHSLAFWVDPGWDGILTLEIKNNKRYGSLPLYPGLRIGQAIVHQLSQPAAAAYFGRYQGATTVETAKPGN